MPPALSDCRRGGHPPGVNVQRGVDYVVDASRAVHLPEGEHPPGVTDRRGVDYKVDASRAVPRGRRTRAQQGQGTETR